jgi:hypothetical protein
VPGDPPSADDADKVDGIHASATPTANKLLALNGASKLPASITGDADTVDSIHAAATPTANKLLAMDANAKFPAHAVAGDLTAEGAVHAGTATGGGAGDVKGSGELVMSGTGDSSVAGDFGVGRTNPEAKFHSHEGSQLGSTPGNHQIIGRISGTANNTMKQSVWLYRHASGSGWETCAFHDGLSVDSAFGTPHSSDKTWIERWPNYARFYWGHGSSTWMALTSTGLAVTGCVTDGTCEIFTEDALAIIKDIHAHGTGRHDEYGHEHFDMAWMFSKYPFLIQRTEEGYFDKLGAKSDLLYRAVMQIEERVEALEAA